MTAQIPIFNLYGEQRWPTPDLLHWESVAERSRLHEWLIKPHRHANLLQLIYLASGTAEGWIDGTIEVLRPPCLLLIPPMCVHGFDFSPDVDGHVVTVALPLIEHLATNLGSQQKLFTRFTLLHLENEDAARLSTLFSHLACEYRLQREHRDWSLQIALSQISVWLARQTEAHANRQSSPQSDKSADYFKGFNQLIERHYRQHLPLDHYAKQLGISTPHLNAICRQSAQRSALQLVHERLLLEAKRNLIYTAMSVTDIANSLGFSEPAYFTRFFKRATALSPQQFRQGVSNGSSHGK